MGTCDINKEVEIGDETKHRVLDFTHDTWLRIV